MWLGVGQLAVGVNRRRGGNPRLGVGSVLGSEGGLPEPSDDDLGLGTTAFRPSEAGAEEAEIPVEKLEHCGGTRRFWLWNWCRSRSRRRRHE